MIRASILILVFMCTLASAQNSPNKKPAAEKFDQIEKVSPSELKKRVMYLRAKLEQEKAKISNVYIINYGSVSEVAWREKTIIKYLFENCRDCYGFDGLRLTFVKGRDTGKPKTIFWILPIGAELLNFDEEIK